MFVQSEFIGLIVGHFVLDLGEVKQSIFALPGGPDCNFIGKARQNVLQTPLDLLPLSLCNERKVARDKRVINVLILAEISHSLLEPLLSRTLIV